jgi:hypothetical protein
MEICQKQYDEKNIRRRTYDVLNVLAATDIISKDKKEIKWKGLSTPSPIEELKVCPQSQVVTFLLHVAYALPAVMLKYNEGPF